MEKSYQLPAFSYQPEMRRKYSAVSYQPEMSTPLEGLESPDMSDSI
jgi:hypothetical protein